MPDGEPASAGPSDGGPVPGPHAGQAHPGENLPDRLPAQGPSIAYRRYRAPRGDGEILADPPWEKVVPLVQANAARLREGGPDLWGCGAGEFRAAARSQLHDLARGYTRAYRDVSCPAGDAGESTLFLLTGHQPRLFHPGVWFKNFALAQLAQTLGAVAIHLIVDNDLTGTTAIRVPTGSVSQPRLESISFDHAGTDQPWEDRALHDPECFDSFGARVSECLRPLVPDPLIRTWWPTAVAASREVGNLGLTLARARHQLEGAWGLNTYELPLSRACETDSFRRFLLGLWHDLPRFREVYNRSLGEYRAVHGIRSRSHPVPELEQADEWDEAPCWIWTKSDPRRRRLFIRPVPGGIELTDRNALRHRLPLSRWGEPDVAVAALADLASSGIRVRPRALLTTMYARVVLSDLFIHGIGGGKYDQLTDAMVRRYFRWEPPEFLVLSATAALPIARPAVDPAEQRRIERQLRDLRFNPDRYVPMTAETEPWVERKRRWLATELPRGHRRPRHLEIERANAALAPHIVRLRDELTARRGELSAQLHRERLLGSREFAFCLHPVLSLQALLLDKRKNDYKLFR